jgi:hypothetical protein
MALKIGTETPSKIYIGPNEAQKIYLGPQEVFTVEQNNIWTPSQIETTIWLDASDAATLIASNGDVSQWNDKSTNGHNMIQADGAKQPKTGVRSMNSLNIIEFDGSSNFMSLVSGFQPGASDVMVLSVVSFDEPGPTTERILNCQVGIGTRFALLNSGAGTHFVASSTYNAANTGYLTGNNIIGGVKLGASQGVGYNGGIYGTNNAGDTVATLDNWYLGCYNGSSEYLDGAIAELIIVFSYDYDLRQKIEGYLAHKWGLTDKLPSDHPYKTNQPLVT